VRFRWLVFFSVLGCFAIGRSGSEAGAQKPSRKLLTGQPAMGDWTGDAPGVRRRITIADLPPPQASRSVSNSPRVVSRPRGAQLQVPAGFKIEQYAVGFRDPRVLRTAPNGDIFVSESRADQIKVMRDKDGDGKPEQTELFTEDQLKKPFGIAFYPPGPDPQYLYVANTDGVIRFPYRNGDLKARGPAEKLGVALSPGGLLPAAATGRVISFFRLTERRCMSRLARAQIIPTARAKRTARGFSSLTLMGAGRKFTPGAFATPSGSPSAQAAMSFG
jgi:glucose/arabinose dehydrogenase